MLLNACNALFPRRMGILPPQVKYEKHVEFLHFLSVYVIWRRVNFLYEGIFLIVYATNKEWLNPCVIEVLLSELIQVNVLV